MKPPKGVEAALGRLVWYLGPLIVVRSNLICWYNKWFLNVYGPGKWPPELPCSFAGLSTAWTTTDTARPGVLFL